MWKSRRVSISPCFISQPAKKKRDVKVCVCVCVCLHRAAGWTAAHKLPAEAFYFIFLHRQFFNQTVLPVEKDLCRFFVEILQNKNVYIYLLLLCYYFLQGVCVYFYLDVQTLISPLWYSQWVVTKQLTTNLLS